MSDVASYKREEIVGEMLTPAGRQVYEHTYDRILSYDHAIPQVPLWPIRALLSACNLALEHRIFREYANRIGDLIAIALMARDEACTFAEIEAQLA